jgi:cholesterol oxidase
MTIDPTTVDLGSLEALREAFLAAPAPTLADLVGEHAGSFGGPRLVRTLMPVALGVLGMPGWHGKRFSLAPGASDRAVGVNLVKRGGQVRDSIPMTARVGSSQLDGQPAMLIAYPPGAPFPWEGVVDELRSFGDGTLLGMNRAVPRVPLWLPFFLHRIG